MVIHMMSGVGVAARLSHPPRQSLILFCLLVFLSRPGHLQPSSQGGPVVTTKYGPLKGIHLQFSSSSSKHLDPVTAYLGIPYASPPINAYRFMPPVAPLPWRETRMATALPPACPQRFPDISNRTRALESMTMGRYLLLQRVIPHLANQSEDCLYLNFYVPGTPPGEPVRPGRFPIVLVIHGESWEWGSGNEFDGAALASLGNHIIVTFNYRLGPLGFLKTSNQQSNFGLLDVIAALHWVKENADSFGGDRGRITLLGYRTGAVVANLLLVAQIAKGLFQRAVLISGSVLSPWALQRRPEDVAKQLSVALGCVGKLPLSHPESDLAPCLRKKPLHELINFQPSSPKFLSPYAPYVDNILLNNPRSVMEAQRGDSGGGQWAKAELLLVFTTSEGVQELNDQELRNGFESEHRDRILRTLVRNVFSYHQQEILSIVRNEYTDWERPILHPIPLRDATVEALSDCATIGPALQVAMIHAKRGAHTYVLHFSHVSRDSEFPGYERLGSLEGDIVPYVMGLPVTNNVPALGGGTGIATTSSPYSLLLNYTKQDTMVAETLINYLANFANTGDPNTKDSSGSALPLSSGGGGDIDAIMSNDDWLTGSSSGSREQRVRQRALHWDPYEPFTQAYLSLGAKARMRNHYRGHKMALWLNLIPQIHLPGGPDVSLSHHALPDDNPRLYIGPVRSVSAFQMNDAAPGFDVVMREGGSQTVSPGGATLTTTECLESTESPLSQGTRHSVLRIDSNEVEVEIRGNGGEPVYPLSSSPGGLGLASGSGAEYDYATAFTVTITVGVCLLLLNLIIFLAIMLHRKRGFPPMLPHSGGGSDTDSRRSSQGGTPQKQGTCQEDFKWPQQMSCCSTNEFPSTHLPYPPISMGGVPPMYQQHNCVDSRGGGGTLPRPAQHPHYHDQTMGGGTLRRHHVGGHALSIPDCVQPVPNAVYSTMPNYEDVGELSGIRLYMNQVPSKHLLDISPSELPSTSRGDDSNMMTTSTPLRVAPHSAVTTTATSSTSSNPSPNSGSTTLVGVLKRNTATTPTSTVKKRVQIQEISV